MRLADAGAKTRGKKTRGRDTFVHKEFQLLLAVEWARACRQVWKENRALAQNLKRGLKGVVVFVRGRLLLGGRSFGKILRFRLLLRSHGFGNKKQNRAESQSPGAVMPLPIVARARPGAPVKT